MKVVKIRKVIKRSPAMRVLKTLRNAGSGYKLAAGMFTGVMAYTYIKGPTVKNEIYRWGLAGIASTLFVELACQPIDTLNMKAKVKKKFVMLKFLQNKGVGSLMRGIQPVIYGMAISSFVYFMLYKKAKDYMKVKMEVHNIDKTSLLSVFAMSAGASTFANLWAIGLYYPFDLVKTRMQIVGEYKYKNIADAFYNIGKEGKSSWKVQNFFRGFGIFSLTFITFTTLEFSIYETIMMYLAGRSRSDIKTSHNSDVDGIFEHKEVKHVSHILIASCIAGAIGGLLTNPLEYLVVNKQAHSKMKISEILKSRSAFDIIFKGSMFRTAYYSTQAVLIFYLLEKFGTHLNCEI